MVGKFVQLRTLNLDFSSSLSCFREDCFSCMPNLKCLSLCETRIANLWTTSSALSKLPSLVELRFQKCLCCDDTGPCPASSGGKSTGSCRLDGGLRVGAPYSFNEDYYPYLNVEEADMFDGISSTSEDSSDDSEVDFTNHHRGPSLFEAFSDIIPGCNELVDLQNEISFGGPLAMQDEEGSLSSSSNFNHISSIVPKKYISCHPSPICYEKHYREYMIASLPELKVLDNLPITKSDRERANNVFSQHFEYLPYKRKNKESIVSILHKREIRASCTPQYRSGKQLYASSAKSQYFFSRTLSAAKVGSSAWPLLRPVSILGSALGDESRNFRPRQFEYHPSDSSFMAFGTLDGEVVVINHENGKIVSYIPSLGAMNSVLGLCWLKRYPSKVWYFSKIECNVAKLTGIGSQ
ncbi:hypothetical protein U1Q18_004039 [Sarracenia purpurea var. burkii]